MAPLPDRCVAGEAYRQPGMAFCRYHRWLSPACITWSAASQLRHVLATVHVCRQDNEFDPCPLNLMLGYGHDCELDPNLALRSAEVTEAPTPETSSSSSAHQESRRTSSPRVSDAEPHHPPVLSSAERRPFVAGGGGGVSGGGGTFIQSAARLPQQADHPATRAAQGGGGTGAGATGSGSIDPASEPGGEGRRSVLASYPVGGVMIREEAAAGEAPVQRAALTRGSSLTSVATMSQEQPDWLRALSHPEPAVRSAVVPQATRMYLRDLAPMRECSFCATI